MIYQTIVKSIVLLEHYDINYAIYCAFQQNHHIGQSVESTRIIYTHPNKSIKMKTLIILVSLLVNISCKFQGKSNCNDLLNGKFRKEVIANGIDRPYQLAYCTHHRRIYFSYNIGSDDEDKFRIGYLNPQQRFPTIVEEVTNGFAITVDDATKTIYFGGSDGIYRATADNPDHIEEVMKQHNIWDIFCKKYIYFISYPAQRLHIVKGNSSVFVPEVTERIFGFAIDRDNDTFIHTWRGIEGIQQFSEERILYQGPKKFRSIQIDREGVAYFCAQNGIYVVDKSNKSLVKKFEVKNVFGVTFDEDNHVIYSNSHEIAKLVPDNKCGET